MSMDSIDFKNKNKFYCPDCNELLHPETEEYSIALANDKGVPCEDCSEGIDFDSEVESEFKAAIS